jgi:hypothetical protein
MSFGNYINIINENNIDTKQNLVVLKENKYIKKLSQFINGGISKLSKKELTKIIKYFKEYEINKYSIGDKQIIPDDEQIKIITSSIDKNIRVIAGAGTGKTTTILCRIKYLLDNHTTPNKILVLTFNVDAKDSLIENIRKMFNFNIKIEIKTIDAFCKKLVYNYYDIENKNDFSNYSLKEYCMLGLNIMKRYGKSICKNYKYVFFDEYQDVNEEQHKILELFVKNNCYLTVIGDDSQNIYQFRGTDNYWIINFDTLINNTITHKITTNYRSTNNIVNIANKSIRHNKLRIEKNMKSYSERNENIILHLEDNNNYNFIINKIQELSENHSYGDMCIISRNSYHLKLLETLLTKYNLPYNSRMDDIYSRDFKKKTREYDKISITTIHNAKGLEWDIVFVVGICDKYFPSQLNNNLVNIEEERRLFYVAITRSKRYLYFYSTPKELPLTRFIDEIKDDIIINNYTKIDSEDLFHYEDGNNIRNNYGVTELINFMSGKIIFKMKKNNIIPKMENNVMEIFNEKLSFTQKIKDNSYESDYGIYCDLYMTRQLMLLNKQTMKDNNTRCILNKIHLTEEELYLVEKHNLTKKYFSKKKLIIKDSENNIKKVRHILSKIQNANISFPPDIDPVIYLTKLISSFVYPKTYLINLHKAYEEFTDNTKNTEDIINSLYYVSLSPKIAGDRKRLIYRNINNLYEENNKKVLKRIDDYIDIVKGNKHKCKVNVAKRYTINKKTYNISGEIDYIDITNKTIIDIKCSEDDFSMEWLIQVLIYYALFMDNRKYSNKENIVIEKIGIINIFCGKYYEYTIPKDYDYNVMLEYIKKLVKNIINGSRENNYIIDVNNIVNVNDKIENKICENNTEYYININDTKQKKYYIILDIENNIINNDIVQFSYIMYDNNDNDNHNHNHNEIKRVNYYVKDSIIDKRCYEITKITNDILESEGILFIDIIKEFIKDLEEVKYICGHYIHTDMRKIINNMNKNNIKLSSNIFDNIKMIGTENLYKKYYNIPSGKLGKMYKTIFNKNATQAHNSIKDVEYTQECYVYLKNKVKQKFNIDIDIMGKRINNYI